MRRTLDARRAELADSLATLRTRVSDDTASVPFGKRAGDHTSQVVANMTNARAAVELEALAAEVDRALAKLADGSYGRCDRCGNAIAAERLEAMPWAPLCVRCRAAVGRPG